MSQIFNRLELQAFRAGITPRTKESREWFMNKAKNMRSINRQALLREDPLVQRKALQNLSRTGLVGTMQMFFYDPKHKDKLPYYDLFPLIVVVGPAEGGFYGLNLHYLPPILRAKMLDSLMETANMKATDDAKFQITYKKLQSIANLRFYEPCFKHYLTKHVKSKFAEVPMPEWEIATFLPTAQFRKANSKKVYSDSRKKIGRN
jgi:hypothetical protein